MKKWCLIFIFSFCSAFTLGDESGVPREPTVAIELGMGHFKIDVDSLDLPPDVLSRLETELMVDDRLAPLVTAPAVQKIVLEPSATSMIVDAWRVQTQNTAEQVRDQILLQVTGSSTGGEKSQVAALVHLPMPNWLCLGLGIFIGLTISALGIILRLFWKKNWSTN